MIFLVNERGWYQNWVFTVVIRILRGFVMVCDGIWPWWLFFNQLIVCFLSSSLYERDTKHIASWIEIIYIVPWEIIPSWYISKNFFFNSLIHVILMSFQQKPVKLIVTSSLYNIKYLPVLSENGWYPLPLIKSLILKNVIDI